jgi:hypothetical protein
MNELMTKLKKNSKSDMISELINTELLNEKEIITTPIIGLNIALSGDVQGGFTSGITTVAGKSKHFKSLFALEMAKGFLQKYEDGVMVFFDSEFGSPIQYFDTFGEAKKRILHVPITTVEELRTEMVNQLDGITRGDHVMFVVDSIGNLASIKETEDAADGKMTVDMTRAKILKSVFRIITPKLVMKNVPMVAINHTYDTLEMFSKQVMGGGTGNVYASDTILFVGKQQEKEGKDITGWNFVLNIEKSRYVKEKEKISILVTYKDGVYRYSGVFDLAAEFGIITSPSQGWYEYKGEKMRKKDLETPELMEEIIDLPEFQKRVKMKYQLNYMGDE